MINFSISILLLIDAQPPEINLEGENSTIRSIIPYCMLNNTFVLHLLFICCKDPIHWNLPFTIMASLVQRASHSSMLKNRRITSEFWAQKIGFKFTNISLTASLWHLKNTSLVPLNGFSFEEEKRFRDKLYVFTWDLLLFILKLGSVFLTRSAFPLSNTLFLSNSFKLWGKACVSQGMFPK